jgi:ectoine hydroxylase-related dioxygenase (phytanoyl-CoA dioxygenase family)
MSATELHRDGYAVLRNWITIPDRELTALQKRAADAEPIFNGSGRNDRRRRQLTLRLRDGTWLGSIRERLAAEFAATGHTPTGFVLLASDPGCVRQAAHQDYVPDDTLRSVTDDAMPLLFLLALEDNTMLDVWPGSHRPSGATRIRRETLCLDPGDAVLFRGDLVHAGSAYETVPNCRVHVYLDHPLVPRTPNRTWIVSKHGSAADRERIDEE